eukprot:c14284_g1_i1.p1 GENE.c14284_g1_i1~~c14284_g1_i1.p1  ORF type:complete len:431 (+),score=85.62 c14284_g1_i1:41-1333(+)
MSLQSSIAVEAGKVFDWLDATHTGKVGVNELGLVLRISRLELRELLIQIKTILYGHHNPEDLALSRDEFIRIMEPAIIDVDTIPQHVLARYRTAFDSIDTLKVGFITPFMLARALGDSMPSHVFTGKQHMSFSQFAKLLRRAEQTRPAKMILDAIEDTERGRRLALALRHCQNSFEGDQRNRHALKRAGTQILSRTGLSSMSSDSSPPDQSLAPTAQQDYLQPARNSLLRGGSWSYSQPRATSVPNVLQNISDQQMNTLLNDGQSSDSKNTTGGDNHPTNDDEFDDDSDDGHEIPGVVRDLFRNSQKNLDDPTAPVDVLRSSILQAHSSGQITPRMARREPSWMTPPQDTIVEIATAVSNAADENGEVTLEQFWQATSPYVSRSSRALLEIHRKESGSSSSSNFSWNVADMIDTMPSDGAGNASDDDVQE